ncbi:Type II/IV secretion system protein [uncultured archaeon]|nr:Type II/IV secretion system protein [uncultured archaeon]
MLEPLLGDDKLEEIMVIGLEKPVYVVHRNYGVMKTNITFSQDKDIRNIIDKIGGEVGRRIDFGSPLLDARLRDGTRVNATIPPISIDGSTLTLRKFRKDPFTVLDMINKNTISLEIAGFLWLVCEGMRSYPGNVLISGGTASGKTTTLNMLASFIPEGERIISIEDTAELALSLSHWIRLETRPPGIENTGEIDMNTLLKNTMRMRPDRIIVGEIRGEEGFTLFSAMNTGHRGAFGTVHANTARETLIRLANPPINVPLIMLSSLNFIIIQHTVNDKKKGLIRRMTEIAEIIPNEKDVPEVQTIFDWDPATDTFSSLKKTPLYYNQLSRYTGLTVSQIGEEHKKRMAFLEDLNRRNYTGNEKITQAINAYYD